MQLSTPSWSPPMRCRCSSPWRPHSRAALMASQGTPSSRSYLSAIGRMTSRANARQVRWNSSWSSLSLKSTVEKPPARKLTAQSIISAGRHSALHRRLTRPGAADAPAIVPRALARFAVPLLLLALVFAGCNLGNEETQPPKPGPATGDDHATEEPGNSSPVTRNTVRVGGTAPAPDHASRANTLYPSPGDGERPTAVALVDQDDLGTRIAAPVLAGPPIGAPLLLSDGDE